MEKKCFECPDRHKGCHTTCGDYAARQARDAEKRETRLREAETNAALFDGILRRVKSSKKKK